jgi:hypothetical protein
MRKGDAVLIFVTEDFLEDREVKLESKPEGRAVLPILKLNLVKKFDTGIYSYSMMTSVFSPIEIYSHPRALKSSTSVQEWCGNVYMQLNLRGDRYSVEAHSYFEKEGDQSFSLDAVWLEDEVWTHIRLDPASLPTGAVRMIPGTMASRLRHTPFEVMNATASLAPVVSPTGGDLMRYTIEYSDRTLAIDFGKAFPHEIAGWSETYIDGFGANAQRLTTRAVKSNSMMIDYWNRHSNADAHLRGELGLER